ncbi:MAG: flagellar assembly protein FliW [Thiohalomonadaceae bacterium]
MQIVTRFFGRQDIDEDQLITFPRGLSGFEQCKRFKLFHEEGKPSVFWLQSVDDPDVMFSVAVPEMFGFGYELTLNAEEEKLLGMVEPEDAVVLVMLRRADEEGGEPLPGYPKLSGNLRAPLIVNTRQRLGLQKIITRFRQATVLRAVDE